MPNARCLVLGVLLTAAWIVWYVPTYRERMWQKVSFAQPPPIPIPSLQIDTGRSLGGPTNWRTDQMRITLADPKDSKNSARQVAK